MIRIVGKRGKGSFESQLDEAAKGRAFTVVDCTSGNPDSVMREGLSPFYLGPVECYDGLVSETFERAWQCAKVYPWMVGADGNPDARYFAWRDMMWATKGFESKSDIRFPAGKGNTKKCLYCWWKVGGEFRRLGYVDARKEVYLRLYAKAVVKTEAYRRLVAMRDAGQDLLLVDFDGYNIHHPKYGFTYRDAIHCPVLKMGHGFVLAMLLEGLIAVENDEVVFAPGLMDDPHKIYSSDLRRLPDAVKLQRNAAALGVTEDEYAMLDASTRKWLRAAAKKEAVYARGLTKAAWKRLPLAEKLACRNV
ncbi:MAG: hypothetical protein Q4G65_11990 [bacterium]|nr:hypothetical protein [bacterium]